MKKKLLLETVLKLKADIEKSIVSIYDDIIKYNFTEKTVDLLLVRAEAMEKQLIIFKEVIQDANKGKIKGITNNYNIYLLSNLKAKRMFYASLIHVFINRKKKDLDKAQITKDDAMSKYDQLTEKIKDLENKLSEFNSKKKVTVYLDDSLNLL
jgi:hypothetical protein